MDRQSRLQKQHAMSISAAEACKRLGIKPASLDSYVNRIHIYRIAPGLIGRFTNDAMGVAGSLIALRSFQ